MARLSRLHGFAQTARAMLGRTFLRRRLPDKATLLCARATSASADIHRCMHEGWRRRLVCARWQADKPDRQRASRGVSPVGPSPRDTHPQLSQTFFLCTKREWGKRPHRDERRAACAWRVGNMNAGLDYRQGSAAARLVLLEGAIKVRFVKEFLMVDWTKEEDEMLLQAGQAGGEYLDSIGVTDLGRLNKTQWTMFLRCPWLGGWQRCGPIGIASGKRRLIAILTIWRCRSD